MTTREKDFVRAVYAFESTTPSDLTLQIDDVVRITEILDGQWVRGQKVGHSAEGIFPVSFVEPLKLPSYRTGQKLFLALQNFGASEPGDLELTKGDVILGTEKVDDSWWRGKNGPLKGIFPLTFVSELEQNDGPRSRSASARSNSLKTRANSIADDSGRTKLQETMFARALVDVRPQLDGELAFQMGDMIEVSEIIDDDWMFGRCRNKEGLVSSVCVELLDEEDSGCESNVNSSFEAKIQDHVQSLIRPGNRNSQSHPRTNTGGSYTSENTRSHDAEVTPYGQVLYPFIAQLPDELSIEEGQIVNLIQHIDSDWTQGEIDGKIGVFPSNFIEIIVDCPCAPLSCSDIVDNDDSTKIHDMEECEGGDEVNKFKESNSKSTQIVDYGEKVAGDEVSTAKEATEIAIKETMPKVTANVSDFMVISTDHEIGLVCHSFQATVEGDISVNEGNTVEVIRKVDENWVEIQSESGQKGLVPINHIEIIGSWPKEESETATTEQCNKTVDIDSLSDSKTAGQSAESPRKLSGASTSKKSLAVLSELGDSTCTNEESYSLTNSKTEPASSSLLVSQVNTSGKDSVLSAQGKNSESRKLSPKPATKPKPKPLISPKPIIAPKPSVIKPTNFYTAKPFSSATSHTSHVMSPTEKKEQMLKSLDTLIEGEITKAKSRSSSSNSDSSSSNEHKVSVSQKPGINSATLPVSLDTALSCSESGGSTFSVDSSLEKRALLKDSLKNEDLAAFDPVVSKPFLSSTADFKPQRPLLSPALSLPEDNDKAKSFPSNKRASIAVMDADSARQNVKLSETVRDNKTSDQVRQTVRRKKDSSFVNSAFEMDVAEGNLIGEVNNVSKSSALPPSTRKPSRAPPPRPKSAIFSSSSETLCVATSVETKKSKSPPPRPTGPRLAPAPSKAPLVPVKADDSQPRSRVVPQRPAPKAPGSTKSLAQTGKSLMLPSPALGGADALTQGARKQIMPTRKAPPRPVTVSVVPSSISGSRSTSDLMQFSPEKSGDEDDDTTRELITDLKSRLEENSTDIKKYEQTREELRRSLSNESNVAKQKELQSNVQFVDSTLQGLREDGQKLRGNLLSISGSEERNERSRLILAQRAEDEKRQKDEAIQREVEQRVKRREQRNKVISEIIDTEKDYLFSLHLCLETFIESEKPPPPGLDIDFLLGNTEEIADVSQKILLNLESNVTGKAFDDQCIGVCFTATAEDMKNTYAPYCRNHDEVIKALESYGDNEEISEYLTSKVDKMKEQMNLFDVSSLLIKPVQRILKYPLFLNELLQNTEDSHQDKQEIVAAIKAMTDVAKAINEYKRRKDLVYKYKKSSDERFSDKIAKLNLHSIKKKSTRIRGRLSTNLGLGLQLKDEGFEKEEAKFRSIEKAVKTFLSSINKYIDQSQEAMRCQENLVDGIVEFYREKECVEVEKFQHVNLKLLDLYVKMRNTIEETVVMPLTAVVKLFNAPSQVIGKRFDKLLDYNHQLGKGGDNEKDLKATKNDYEAMNAQLMDELPKFYNITFNLLQHCMSAFVQARRDFMDQSLKESCALLELPSMISKDHMMEIFKIRHTTAFDHMSMLNFIPRGFNPKVDTVKADRARQRGKNAISDVATQQALLQTIPGGQSESQRTYLYQTYPPEKLYTVTMTHNVNDLMDISLIEGTIVGVVKELDPMGNKDRWFVDDGATKGFAPSNVLSKSASLPLTAAAAIEDDINSFHSYDSTSMIDPGSHNKIDDKISYNALASNSVETVPFQTMESLTPLPRQKSDEAHQYYYALYDFQARHANEASLTAGTPVMVLAKQDSDGNPEWWMVDSDGKRGYAPANYMAPMPYS